MDPYLSDIPANASANIISSRDAMLQSAGFGQSFNEPSVDLFASDFSSAMRGTPMDSIMNVAERNNMLSGQQAAITRSWQESQNQKAMNFNALEASKNRNWQEYMSNTAHQREVADLLNAGLNPVLSATGGNGASVGSGAQASGVTSAGATGQVDNSATGALTSYLAQMLAAQTSILNTQVSADAAMANSELMSEANRYAASVAAGASRYVADVGHENALLNYDAQMSDPYRALTHLIMTTLTSMGISPEDATNTARQAANSNALLYDFTHGGSEKVIAAAKQIGHWFLTDPFGYNKRWYIDDGWVHLINNSK